MTMVPSTNYVLATTTLLRTSSSKHFLRNLQDIIFVSILVAMSLTCLIMILGNPVSMSYFLFISSAIYFSFVLSSRNILGSIPCDGSPMMCAMSSMSIETSYSIHTYSPCVTANNFFSQLVPYWPHPKSGRSKIPKIPVLANFVAHGTSLLIGSQKWSMATVYIYTLLANSGNLSMSLTSWSEYVNFYRRPNKSSFTHTPSSIRNVKIVAASCLYDDLGTICLSFRGGGWI